MWLFRGTFFSFISVIEKKPWKSTQKVCSNLIVFSFSLARLIQKIIGSRLCKNSKMALEFRKVMTGIERQPSRPPLQDFVHWFSFAEEKNPWNRMHMQTHTKISFAAFLFAQGPRQVGRIFLKSQRFRRRAVLTLLIILRHNELKSPCSVSIFYYDRTPFITRHSKGLKWVFGVAKDLAYGDKRQAPQCNFKLPMESENWKCSDDKSKKILPPVFLDVHFNPFILFRSGNVYLGTVHVSK